MPPITAEPIQPCKEFYEQQPKSPNKFMNKEIPLPILRWPGGKTRMFKKILARITPHVCYCEPFAGGLAVLFAKKRSQVEPVKTQNGCVNMRTGGSQEFGELIITA
jgi:hypothetical protein